MNFEVTNNLVSNDVILLIICAICLQHLEPSHASHTSLTRTSATLQ